MALFQTGSRAQRTKSGLTGPVGAGLLPGVCPGFSDEFHRLLSDWATFTFANAAEHEADSEWKTLLSMDS